MSLDPLAGGVAFEATVVEVDDFHDLAVLESAEGLGGSAGRLVPTDGLALEEPVVVTGVADVDDPGHKYRFLDAAGWWAGGTTRNEELPLGRFRSSDVMPGMSDAPVRRRSDDGVVGVVSGRYNSTDGWLESSVWVARTERLELLLPEGSGVQVAAGFRAQEGADLVLSVSEDGVRLHGSGVDVSAAHRGVSPGLANAVDDVRRRRATIGGPRGGAVDAGVAAGSLALRDAGRLLGESFLPVPVADGLRSVLVGAEAQHAVVRVGVEVAGPLSRLPWEALADPVDGRPLCLVPNVTVYRRVPSPAGVGGELRPGPLQIVVAIASGTGVGAGGLLDYEDELRNVIKAVRAARSGNAEVRVVPFATTSALRQALQERPAHVLHVSGHGSPGLLVLEDDDGGPREVNADIFVDEAIPPGRMPAVVALAACYSNVAAAVGGPSFATRLLERGASAVVATETSVTDLYATRVFARVYGQLAAGGTPELLEAVADARRAVQVELAASTTAREKRVAVLDEWSTVTVLSASAKLAVFDPSLPTMGSSAQHARPVIGGLTRQIGDFVCRRAEQRRWPTELLTTSLAGIVIFGIGGVGKTTLAEEVTARVLEGDRSRLMVTVTAQVTVDDLLKAIGGGLRRRLLRDGGDPALSRDLDLAARVDLGWADRYELLRERLLENIPVLVVVDNFEDNLIPTASGRELRDPALAGLLARWASDPGRSRLLITSRHPFGLPGGADDRLSFRPLGPLSFAETLKLIWSLPALDRLDTDQVERLWRMVGGHPARWSTSTPSWPVRAATPISPAGSPPPSNTTSARRKRERCSTTAGISTGTWPRSPRSPPMTSCWMSSSASSPPPRSI